VIFSLAPANGRTPTKKMMEAIKVFFLFDTHVCPCWLCYAFDNPIRKRLHNPEAILGKYINEGSTVLDIGAGMGYFTIPMARMAGKSGMVTAADIQYQMLKHLRSRAKRAGEENSITTHICTTDTLGIDDEFDFILAFWMAHEVKNKEYLLKEIYSLLKPNGRFLIAEPKIHTEYDNYQAMIAIAG
jgi:ubiquinone/menaquinone biosynthesis C-methylase UbiE